MFITSNTWKGQLEWFQLEKKSLCMDSWDEVAATSEICFSDQCGAILQLPKAFFLPSIFDSTHFQSFLLKRQEMQVFYMRV